MTNRSAILMTALMLAAAALAVPGLAAVKNYDYGHTRYCGDIPHHYPTTVNATRNVSCRQALRIAVTVAAGSKSI